jgi:hypothetical protein
MTYGPNVRKLLAEFIAREAIPPGGGFYSGITFFTDEKRRQKVLEDAEFKMNGAIKAVKAAFDNPYGNDDEAIAEAILKQIQEYRNEIRRRG